MAQQPNNEQNTNKPITNPKAPNFTQSGTQSKPQQSHQSDRTQNLRDKNAQSDTWESGEGMDEGFDTAESVRNVDSSKSKDQFNKGGSRSNPQ